MQEPGRFNWRLTPTALRTCLPPESHQITQIIRTHAETVLRASDGRTLGRWTGTATTLLEEMNDGD